MSRINIERSVAINLNVVPKVLFTGMKSDFKKEFSLAFGDYCEVYDGMDKTLKEQSVPSIVLYPCNNAAGSLAFLNMKSKKQRLQRSQWVKMVTTEDIMVWSQKRQLQLRWNKWYQKNNYHSKLKLVTKENKGRRQDLLRE
jgi:hypothetical protein